MGEPSDETKKHWKENAKELFWNCPHCENVGMVQYRVENDNPGNALCPECLTVFTPNWELVDSSPIGE